MRKKAYDLVLRFSVRLKTKVRANLIDENDSIVLSGLISLERAKELLGKASMCSTEEEVFMLCGKFGLKPRMR